MATCFQKTFHGKYPIASVYIIYIFFIEKTGNFRKFLKTKSDQNTHQNAQNCTIFKNLSGDNAPRTP